MGPPLLLLLLASVHQESLFVGATKCFSPQLERNISFVAGKCSANGTRTVVGRILPGSYTCKGPSGNELSVLSRIQSAAICNASCKAGEFLSLGGAGEAAGRGQCKKCPQNTFSVGGGRTISLWTGKLVQSDWDIEKLPSEESPFYSLCYGFNATRFEQSGIIGEAWQRGYNCEPWMPTADGKASSGNNRQTSKVRSELHMKLRFTTKGKLWFTFRVDADAATEEEPCPWLEGDTGLEDTWQCGDGTYGNSSFDCNFHGGRAKCPRNFPEMCAQPNLCAGGLAFCCSIDCSTFGGPRLCPGSGGLQVLVCRDERVRTCKPVPLRPLPFHSRFYVSSEMQWRWVEFDVPAGWVEVVFNYMRDGAVAGQDEAMLGELGWVGTKTADLECSACPAGKQSVEGAARCSSCGRDEIFDKDSASCQACASNFYALPGFDKCLLRPTCSMADYVAKFSECDEGGKRNKWFEWLEPKICEGGVHLPPAHNGVNCAPCPSGKYRDGKICRDCPPGHFSEEDMVCKVCPAGHFAPRERVISEFREEDMEAGLSTGCVGLCGSKGWRGRVDFIDSGVDHLAPAESWLQLDLNMSDRGSIEFVYGLNCNPKLSSFMLTVDGKRKQLQATCANGSTTEQGKRLREKFPIRSGVHKVRWTFRRVSSHLPGSGSSNLDGFDDQAQIFEILVVNTETGGASKCLPCPPGLFSSGPSARCQPCPPGFTGSSVVASSLCKACEKGKFAPAPGSATCRVCGEGSSSEEAAVLCSCVYNSTEMSGERGQVLYNTSVMREKVFGPVILRGKDGLGSRELALFLSFCSTLPPLEGAERQSAVILGPNATSLPEGCDGVFACMVEWDGGKAQSGSAMKDHYLAMGRSDGLQLNAGSQQGFADLPEFLSHRKIENSVDSAGIHWRSGGGFTVRLGGGAACPLGQEEGIETRVYAVCQLPEPGTDMSRVTESMHLMRECGSRPCDEVAGPCVLHVLWETHLACPVCTADSFAKVSTPCVNGRHDVSFKMVKECFGGLPKPQEIINARCEIDFRSLFGVGDLIALVVVCLLTLAMFGIFFERYVMYKKLYSRYKNLEHELGGDTHPSLPGMIL